MVVKADSFKKSQHKGKRNKIITASGVMLKKLFFRHLIWEKKNSINIAKKLKHIRMLNLLFSTTLKCDMSSCNYKTPLSIKILFSTLVVKISEALY